LGWRAFAEACDGVTPQVMVGDLLTTEVGERGAALDKIRKWIGEVDAFAPVDELAVELEPWVEQAGHETGLWRAAIRVLRALDRNDGDRAMAEAMGLIYLWPSVRRRPISVMGPRHSFRPVFGQWPDGSWRYDASSLQEHANATDALVRFALGQLAVWSPAAGSRQS
jgi:hypothetical protein